MEIPNRKGIYLGKYILRANYGENSRRRDQCEKTLEGVEASNWWKDLGRIN